MKGFRRALSGLCALLLLAGLLPTATQAAKSAFSKQSGHFNCAYIEWEPVAGATGYQVFVKGAAEADSAYKRIDDQLVRKYPDHWRADALGLKAGDYQMKVVPVKGGTAMEPLVTDTLEVLSHERTGYAFAGGSVPGAYKMDGTLKANAQVVYVTESTKNSVKLGGYTGFQNIVTNVNQIGTPVDIRIIGRVTGLSDCLLRIQGSSAQLTIEGVGNDATAYGWGVEIKNTSNLELANLGVMMVDSSEGDGVTLERAVHTWVHNCDFFYNTARNDDGQGDKEKGDGSLDTKHSTYITHAYNHFWDAGKCNLQGSGITDTSDWITYHHNWYDHSDSRHPRVRVAHVHVFNNYYDNNDGYGIGAVYHATVFSDRNYFDNCKQPMLIAYQGSDTGYFTGNSGAGEDGGMTKAYGNIVVGGTYVPYSKNSTSFDAYDVTNITDTVPSSVKSTRGGWGYDNFDTDANKFYTYTVDAAVDVPAKVKAYAGRVEGGDLQYDMTKLQNANSKYPDTGLLTVLKAYTSSLVSVGGNGGSTVTDPDPVDPTPTTPVTGKVYTLTGDEVFAGEKPSGFTLNTSGQNAGSYTASAVATQTAGTDDFFTLLYGANSRLDPSAKSFDDGYQAAHRINFSNAASTSQNAVRFQVDGPCVVKVWWVGAVAADQLSTKDPRPMTILNGQGQDAVTPSQTVRNDVDPMISTFSLTDAGTYYLGGKGGKNFIYKVTVAVGDTLGDLPWSLDAAGKLALTGTVPVGETVWAACWDDADGFLGARALTGTDPAVTLPQGWARGKLIWLGSALAPKCESASF